MTQKIIFATTYDSYLRRQKLPNVQRSGDHTGESFDHIGRVRRIARGQILGDTVGMVKLLFHQETRKLLGVHAIGQGTTELIHIGQAVLAFQGTIDFFIENTFNYPTLAECYRVAALDGYNKVMARE